ncbi:MAG: glycosyltransferase family 39 protein, partial [bacterium]|nr:glycosyltransferase family 39 protein [bacterium]
MIRIYETSLRKYLTPRNLLLGILVLAFLIRFWGAGNRDFFGDEGVDAFRGVGYVDYLGTSFQTQPIDWYKGQVLPWWAKLSFHDFPPMAMAIQHAFFVVFGDSLLIARLPAIVLGTLSALLIYLIVKRFFKEKMALLAAFLFSINSVMVWIFRTSILEPTLLFFILLNIYYFFRFSEDKSYWRFFGGTLGLVALTKYTGIFLLPAYGIYLLIFHRDFFKRRELYLALGLALILFSPVLIYNFYLYQATGHFDLQIAYLLGQETPEWTGLVGKVQAPFSEIWENLTTGAYEPDGTFSSVVSYQIPFLFSSVMG